MNKLQLILSVVVCTMILLLTFGLYFYRKPTIYTYRLESPQIVRGPAFGRVMSIKHNIPLDTYFIAIFLSPFDIHYQLNPIDGIIQSQRYDATGKYELAYDLNKSQDNEKCITTYVEPIFKNKVELYQIAGFVARRIRSYVRPQQQVQKGQLMGLILLGSRVDLIIHNASHFELLVQENEYVFGSQTRIGTWNVEQIK